MTYIAVVLACAPIVGLGIVYFELWQLFLALADSANQDREALMARSISTALWAGQISAVLFAVGFRLHLRASRLADVGRPWVWKQVFFMGLLIVFYFPAIVPLGLIAMLFTLKFSEMKKLNVEQEAPGSA